MTRRSVALPAVLLAASAGCSDSPRGADGSAVAATQVRPSCASPSTTFIDYAAGARGDHRSPVAVARAHLRGEDLRDSDRLVTSGSEGRRSLVGVVRGEETVAVLQLRRADDGGWLVDRITRCAGGSR